VVADVVPLHDENRILVRHGLARLRQSPLPGLRALCQAAGLPDGTGVRSTDIGYRLAPRLNAAGRLGCARAVVDLLTTTRIEQAEELARGLEEKNQERQRLERDMIQQARRQAEDGGLTAHPALVLAHPGWHAGVIGIVAGRMADLYGRPALVISLPPTERRGQELAMGSGRSIPGFALHEALAACTDLLAAHGGHSMAAGFRLLPDNVTAFRQRLCAFCDRHFPNGTPAPSLVLDAEIPLSVLTLGLMQDVDRLEPYGADNRRPVFLAGPLELLDGVRKVGQTQRHLSFRVRQQGITLRAIAFGMADRTEELLAGNGQCFLAFTPQVNEWMGKRTVELEVVDFQAGGQVRLS
jgi:single-stranded-DNA-specific exonuclease